MPVVRIEREAYRKYTHEPLTVKINNAKIKQLLEDVIDDKTMLAIHTLFAKMCDPYVPMKSGALSQTIEITPDGVRYTQPYAHYQYIGEVYGPNYHSINKYGEGYWWSAPGVRKIPMDYGMTYDNEIHLLATNNWDSAMMRDRGDEFIAAIKEIIKRRAKELYG
jgi:hypothetical protein